MLVVVYVVVSVCFGLVSQDRVSLYPRTLCQLGWPGTHRDHSASASGVPGLKACPVGTAMPASGFQTSAVLSKEEQLLLELKKVLERLP